MAGIWYRSLTRARCNRRSPPPFDPAAALICPGPIGLAVCVVDGPGCGIVHVATEIWVHIDSRLVKVKRSMLTTR